MPYRSVTTTATAGGVLSAVLVWFWIISAQGKVYLTLAVLWCCDSDSSEAAIILNHDPSIVAAVACGVTVACIIAAVWLIFRPGEKSSNHVKYDILRSDR
jgi:hypothetical protein